MTLEALFSIGIIAVVVLTLLLVFGYLHRLIEKRRAGKYQWQPDLGYDVAWTPDHDATMRPNFYTPVLRDKMPEQVHEERRAYLKESQNDRHQRLDR